MALLWLMLATAVAAPTQLVAGNAHACALYANGEVYCWGDNRKGQLARGTLFPDPGAARVPLDVHLVSIDAAGDSTCGLDKFHRAWCWGSNTNGLFPGALDAHRTSPELVRGLGPLGSLVVGSGVSCGLAPDRPELWCWGVAAKVKGPTMVDAKTCVVGQDGRLGCAAPSTEAAAVGHAAPDLGVPALRNTDPAAGASGDGFTCAIGENGVLCRGINTWGQLGLAVETTRLAPVDVGLASVVDVVSGENHVCALTRNGSVFCWGANDAQQVDATGADALEPTEIVGPKRVVELAASATRTCARTKSHAVWCWGRGSPPEQVLEGATATASGCAVVADHVTCWNKLPNPSFTDVLDVAVGKSWACALREGGKVSCFDAKGGYDLPMQGLVGIALAEGRGVGWTAEGQATAWTNDPKTVLQPWSDPMLEVRPSQKRTCGVRPGGTVRCEDFLAEGVHLDVPGLADVAQLALGADHLCARTNAGHVVCLLSNDRGQLGFGVVTPLPEKQDVPVPVAGLP